MNANLFKKSRWGWPHLSACYRVCIRSRQSLGSWVFGIRVREGFLHQVGQLRTSTECFSAHSRSLAVKKKISS